MKINHLSLGLALAFAACAAHAQLAYTNEGVTSLGASTRTNAHDVSILNNLQTYAGSSFTLDTMPGLTFNDITGAILPNEFAVGNNGSFPVSVEVAFLYRNAIDHDQLLSMGSSTLFDSSDVAGLANTMKITSAGLSSNPLNWVNFQYTDLSMGTNATMFDPDGFKIFLASEDPHYNYYIFGDEDRKGNYDNDFNDFNFIARVNTSQIGFQPVPEPSTYGIFAAIGMIGLAAFRRRRRNTEA